MLAIPRRGRGSRGRRRRAGAGEFGAGQRRLLGARPRSRSRIHSLPSGRPTKASIAIALAVDPRVDAERAGAGRVEQRDDGRARRSARASPSGRRPRAAASPVVLVVGAHLQRQRALAGGRDHLRRRGSRSRSRPRARAGAGRRRRGRSRRARPRPACAGGCRRCRAAPRPAGPVAPPAAGRGGAGSRSRPARPRAPLERVAGADPDVGRVLARAAPRRSPGPPASPPGRSLAEWTPISASPSQQRPLDPAHEARLVARLAVGGDLDQLRPAEQLGDPARLGQRQRTAAGGDPQRSAPLLTCGAAR